MGGESEDAIKQRISREFGYGEGESEQREEEDEEDDDPLEAFMAGLEVNTLPHTHTHTHTHAIKFYSKIVLE